MERLQSLLRQYNLLHQEDFAIAPWSRQYCEEQFPKYWELVYAILETIDKTSKVLEVGCGLGDITSILCYLGYRYVIAFEKDFLISSCAKKRMENMFGRTDIIRNEHYPNKQQYSADVLILVNCAYAGLASSKQEYLEQIHEYYVYAGSPKYYLLEVIDASYTKDDDEFPAYIRLNKDEVTALFPSCNICSWETYKYPINRKSKTLYLIERI